jgi:IS4 transposase
MSFDAEVYRRLPLADATLQMLRFVADAEFLAALFDRHRGRSYERQIAFADLVHLLADGLVVHGQSAHRSFQQAHAAGNLSASARAAYDKVARLPVGLSAALLTQVTARLRGLLPGAGAEAVPDSLAGFTPLAFDGKKIKKVARRLQAVRSVRGHVLGGKILVAEDLRTGLAAALEADPDGEASDLALLPGLLARARAVVAGPRLWVGDRLFCDLIHLPLLATADDHFVVRHCGKVRFHPDPDRPAQTGVNRRGQTYTDEWGWLGGPTDERRRPVRRITVHRPDAEDVAVVTSLTDAQAYPAADVLELYLRRWGIERLFQKVTEVFHLRALVSAQANGTVFQAALCLLLYNLTVVIRAHVAAGATKATADVSLEKLFEDVRRQLTGLTEVLGVPAVIAQYALVQWTADGLRDYLRDVLGPTWRDWWTKSPPRKKSKPTPTEYLKGGHSSVYRIVRGLHETITEQPPPTEGPERPSKQ